MTAIDFNGIILKLRDHALATGLVSAANGHEAKSPPGTKGKPTIAFWVSTLGPDKRMSGQASTALQMVVTGRIYQDGLMQPADMIDPTVLNLASILMEAYSGDFTLGGSIREVDLLGRMGPPMSGKAGYLTLDNTIYRVFDITIPLALSEEWTQSG